MMAGLLQFMGLGHLAVENFLNSRLYLKEQLWISSSKARFFRTEKQFLGTLCSDSLYYHP